MIHESEKRKDQGGDNHYAEERYNIKECWRETQKTNPISSNRAGAKVVSNMGTIGFAKKITPNPSCYDILWANRIERWENTNLCHFVSK